MRGVRVQGASGTFRRDSGDNEHLAGTADALFKICDGDPSGPVPRLNFAWRCFRESTCLTPIGMAEKGSMGGMWGSGNRRRFPRLLND